MNAFNSCHLRSRLWRDKSCRWLDKSIDRLFDRHRRTPLRHSASQRRVSLRLITLIGLLWFGVLALRAADYYVATNGTDNPTCTDWANAASNIQYAVDLTIGEGDTVWVSNGSYRVTNQITITNNITVRSTNGYANTFVYADWPFWTTRCFYVSRAGGVGVTNGIVRNCLIHHNTNTAANCGGGVTIRGGRSTNGYFGVFNCTIVDNYSSGGEGGGIITLNVTNLIMNCLIANNRSLAGTYPDAYNADAAGTNNYFYSCILTSAPLAPDHGNITNNPLFAGAGNWRLAANSPCVNTGTNQNWMTNSYDLDDRTRIRYGTVDMGAYELIYEGTIYKLW